MPHPPSIPDRRLCAALRCSAALGLTIGACEVGDPITATRELPENPGVIIAGAPPVAGSTGLAWSPDGLLLSFETESGSLATVDVETGRLTTRDGPRDEHEELSPARDGGAIYFLADRAGGRRSAYRLPANGDAVQLTDRAPGTRPVIPGDGSLVLGGPGDRQVAFINEPDSLFVFDVAAGTREFVAAGCTRAVVFSPDGRRLVCKRPAQGSYAVFNLASGTLDVIVLQPSERESMLLHTRWTEADSLRSLYRTLTRFRVRTVATGGVFSIWIPLFVDGVRETDFTNWSWSASGEQFAFWVHECLKLDRLGGCDHGQSVLYVVDLGDNTGQPVVVVKGERGGEQVALSPDGTRVAFVFEGRLHLQTIS